MFIGIDQSLEETAITVLFSPIHYKTFCFKGKGKTSINKITYLSKKINFILNNISIEYAAIEGGSYSSLGKLFTLGQLSGSILYILSSKKIPTMEIPPKSLKLFISGRGDASKQFMIKRIKEKYNQIFNNDNIADSYALAILAYRYYTKKLEFREEAEVLYKLKNPTKKRKIRYKKTIKNF